jgi:hypothetical protein
VLPLIAFVAVAGLLRAQQAEDGKDDDEVRKAGPKDPYTDGDAEAMAAAGIVAYSPFPWADWHSTDDVDKVLGDYRILWIETAHFRVGSGLKSAPWPDDKDKRKALQAEIDRLRTRLPKIPRRVKRIDPWLRLHLYAQRAETCYAQFMEQIGKTDADFPKKGIFPREGEYLGMPNKFLLLMFQKKSDMVRYMTRFCGRSDDTSMRYYHDKTHQMIACVAAEGLEGFDETALHAHMVYVCMHNLVNGYNGYFYDTPLWLGEGLAHWYSRRVPSDGVNVNIRDDEAVDEETQGNWPLKVRRRAQHTALVFPFEEMATWSKWEEMGYHQHAQAWSRIDYLMSLDPKKVGEIINRVKLLPTPKGSNAEASKAAREMAAALVVELFELEPAEFDRKWRDWVLKTYPKK